MSKKTKVALGVLIFIVLFAIAIAGAYVIAKSNLQASITTGSILSPLLHGSLGSANGI